jgi:glyoxalase family protein
MPDILGLHHVTAIAGDPQRNVDFYAGTLGLRLVKMTVNYDDPSTYHLYYGDGQGHPGTIMTFFPWSGDAPRGRIGTGQTSSTAFAVPEHSLQYWREHLRAAEVEFEEARSEFDDKVLLLSDPDGLQLELVATPEADPDQVWAGGSVPTEFGIRGFHHVTLTERGHGETASLLTEMLGFKHVQEHGSHFRYSSGTGLPGSLIDIVDAPHGVSGQVAVGTVHHIALRTPTDEQQENWRTLLVEAEFGVTPIIDRTYFHSIYFREPGGVLFEIATDPPGFAVDEPAESMGTKLVLPRWLQDEHELIERELPRIVLPGQGGKANAAD